MTREEAINWLKAISFVSDHHITEAIGMAIEALSQPIVVKCYEIDNDRVYCSPEMADKIYRALHEDTNVQNMHRGEWIDDDYWNGRVPTHGRLIDADALSKKLCETTIFIKDGEVFQRMINDAPTVQADRPHGEWVGLDECSVCGKQAFDFIEGYVDGVEYLPNFCPNCGADMRKENE